MPSSFRKHWGYAVLAAALFTGAGLAQQAPPPPGRGGGNNVGGSPPPAGGPGRGRQGGPEGRGGGGRSASPGEAELGPPGRWWDEAKYVQDLGLSNDQQKKMDEIFDANRVPLSEKQASVEVAEVELTPLLAPDQPDEAKVLAQIDRISQARAELEKANARMLLAVRKQLTHDQWVKLQAERPAPPPRPQANPPAAPAGQGDGPGDGPGD